MAEINFDHFLAVDIRVGTVIKAEPFPEARKPAIKLWIDFGSEIGEKKSSAQITDFYNVAKLIGQPVLGVVKFPPRALGPCMSVVRVLGFMDKSGSVILAVPDKPAPDGSSLC